MTYTELPVDNVFSLIQLTPMTDAQRDALTAVTGMVIFNSDSGVLEFYNGATWGAV